MLPNTEIKELEWVVVNGWEEPIKEDPRRTAEITVKRNQAGGNLGVKLSLFTNLPDEIINDLQTHHEIINDLQTHLRLEEITVTTEPPDLTAFLSAVCTPSRNPTTGE